MSSGLLWGQAVPTPSTSTLQHFNASTLQRFNTSTLQRFNSSTLHNCLDPIRLSDQLIWACRSKRQLRQSLNTAKKRRSRAL
jgi:hypothetical protein